MPTYTFINDITNEEKNLVMTMSERESFLSDNPEWKQKLVFPKIVTHVGGTLKQTSDGWKDHLKNIKKHSGKGNTINV